MNRTRRALPAIERGQSPAYDLFGDTANYGIGLLVAGAAA